MTDTQTPVAHPFTLQAILLVLTYWAFQSVAAMFFKLGSTSDDLWMPMFWGGSLLGGGSIAFMMVLYRTMNPNVALGICFGGAFLCAQITVAVVFHSVLTPVQWIGLFGITGGMAALAMGGANDASATDSTSVEQSTAATEPSTIQAVV